MRKENFKGFNDEKIVAYFWDDVENPKGVVQIAHGMAEDLSRYHHFAAFLNSQGYIAVGDDHRGHGDTVGDALGTLPEGDCFFDTLKDMSILTDIIKKKYNNLPIFIFGHSYGSFLTQAYIQEYSDNIKGAILCGSAAQNSPVLKVGNWIAKTQLFFCGKNKPAKMISKTTFSVADKQFKGEGKNAWLSRDKNVVDKYNASKRSGFILPIEFFESMTGAFSKLYKKKNLEKIRKDLPILIISGDKDPIGSNGKSLKKLLKIYQDLGIENVDLKLYKDARHELLNELNKEEVMNDILNFYNAAL